MSHSADNYSPFKKAAAFLLDLLETECLPPWDLSWPLWSEFWPCDFLCPRFLLLSVQPFFPTAFPADLQQLQTPFKCQILQRLPGQGHTMVPGWVTFLWSSFCPLSDCHCSSFHHNCDGQIPVTDPLFYITYPGSVFLIKPKLVWRPIMYMIVFTFVTRSTWPM